MYLTVNEFIMDIVMCFALICTMFIPIYIFKFVMKIYGYYIGHKISKELEKDNDFLDKVKRCKTEDEGKLLIIQTIMSNKYKKYI